MNILIFDTETISIGKPYCYNIGYIICNTDFYCNPIVKKDFVIEQVWHNPMLFSTAYYAEKRPIYISLMRGKKAKLKKYGYVMQEMIKDIENYDVTAAYAYNSAFDDKVFSFNCDYYKCNNPLDSIPIFDIRGYVHKCLAFTEHYQNFCEQYQLFTDAGNYSTTAETAYKYILNSNDFTEKHTALADAEIETIILKHCIANGLEYNTEYKVYNTIPRKVPKSLNIYIDKQLNQTINYTTKIIKGSNLYLKTK